MTNQRNIPIEELHTYITLHVITLHYTDIQATNILQE